MLNPVYIIGDIHANIGELERLFSLAAIERDAKLIFLGDYIDKGIRTRETINFLARVRDRHETSFIRGNHEYVWDRYLNYGDLPRRDFLLNYGGAEALAQFDPDPTGLIRRDEIEKIRRYLKDYLALIELCVDHVLLHEHLAIHAGLDPAQRMTSPLALTERNFFIRPEKMDLDALYLDRYCVVAGHSSLGEAPFIRRGYLNIDFGAGYGKYLGAFDVSREKIIRSDGVEFALGQNNGEGTCSTSPS